MLALAIHDQADSISDKVARYEEPLLRSVLPNLERRKTSMTDYRLERATDCLCTIEPAAIKCAAKEDGETHNKFFGGIGPFKKNRLKQARRKAIKRMALADDASAWPRFQSPYQSQAERPKGRCEHIGMAWICGQQGWSCESSPQQDVCCLKI